MMVNMTISVRDHMALRLAAARYKYPAARETDVLEQLGWSAPVFWARVNALVDHPDAIAAYPVECRRLRDLRDARRRLRSA